MTARRYSSRGALVIGLSVLAGVAANGATDELSFARVAPEEIQWSNVPGGHGVDSDFTG